MTHETNLKAVQKEWHGTLSAYVIGLTLSIFFTGAAFFLVAKRVLREEVLIYTIIGLAVLQAIAQLLFFLHLGKEHKPRWETIVFLFMVLVLLIIVAGSLWIMFDLNNRVMEGMM